MIFEITYNELQVPLAMIKELLTDKEYKGDVKLVTFEVTKEQVSLLFDDDRLGIRFKYDFHEAEPELPGTATCSFASFYELVKVFKKSEEAILIERDGISLRVDDGQYPEELMALKPDKVTNPYPQMESAVPYFSIESDTLIDGIQLASTILRKTDIPAGNIDTQAVYVGTGLGTVSFTSFSLHNFHRSIRPAMVSYDDRLILLTKPVASAVAKIVVSGRKHILDWQMAEFPGDDFTSSGILLQSEDAQATFSFKLEPIDGEASIRATFDALEVNFKEAVKSATLTSVKDISGIGKVKTDDNVVIKNGEFHLEPSGYPAQLVRKLWEKGAWKENGKVFYVESGSNSAPIMCLYEEVDGEEKITGLSYRTALTA